MNWNALVILILIEWQGGLTKKNQLILQFPNKLAIGKLIMFQPFKIFSFLYIFVC